MKTKPKPANDKEKPKTPPKTGGLFGKRGIFS